MTRSCGIANSFVLVKRWDKRKRVPWYRIERNGSVGAHKVIKHTTKQRHKVRHMCKMVSVGVASGGIEHGYETGQSVAARSAVGI